MKKIRVLSIVMGLIVVLLISCKSPISPQVDTSSTKTPVPAISVAQGTAALASTASFDFGSTTTSSSAAPVTFTITDSGTADLVLSGSPAVALSGADAADFSVTEPAVTTISPSQSTSFEITFAPSTVGAKNASLSIADNVDGQSPYTLRLTGTATLTPTPAIQVSQGTTSIASGTGSYSFGDVTTGDVGAPVAFTIRNAGTADLTLSGASPVSLGGTNPGDFSVTQPASGTLAPGATTTFTVSFTSTAGGARSATVSIANDDPNKSPFSFSVGGTAYTPQIDVTDQASASVGAGGTFDFGAIYTSQTAAATFHIGNTGPAKSVLRLGSPNVSLAGTDATCFVVAQPATSTVSGGTSTTFTVTFKPQNSLQYLKTFTATVQISSNDPTDGSYTFTVTGSTHYASFTTYGTSGTATGQLDQPEDVLYNPVDSHHYLYVADRGRSRILMYDSTTGAYVGEFGSSGTSSGHDIAGPVGLAADSSGNIYVASINYGLSSNFRFIQKYDAAGNWLTGWGITGSGNGSFSSASAIAIGPDTVTGGQGVFVADQGNNLIQVFGTDGTFRRQWSVTQPKGVVVLSTGTVLVASSDTYIQSFNNSGTVQADWHQVLGDGYVSHMALRSDLNKVFLNGIGTSSYGGIRVCDVSTGNIVEWIDSIRYPAGAGALFRNPRGMSWGNGNLYFVNNNGGAASTYGNNMLVIAKYQP